MKKAIIGTVAGLLITMSTAKAEMKYDYKNPEHIQDKKCLAMFSWAGDLFFNSGDMESYRQTVDYNNNLILKYAYSKQLNTHVDAYKSVINSKIKGGYTGYQADMLNCIARSL